MTNKDDSETMRLRQADAGEKAWRRWGPYPVCASEAYPSASGPGKCSDKRGVG